jgi:hypothetical protein
MRTRIVLLAVVFLVGIPLTSPAIEPGNIDCNATNTFCASTCELADVQAAADDAIASGLTDTTIYIPACAADPHSWPVGEKLVLQTDAAKSLRLIGSGQTTTRIVHFQIDVPDSTRLNLVELGHIYTNNRFDSDDCRIVLYWDSGAATYRTNCGTGPGQTCDRCDTIDCQRVLPIPGKNLYLE